MTARETLRDIASDLDSDCGCGCSSCAAPKKQAAALRALADRLDHEEAEARTRAAADTKLGWDTLICGEIQVALLARLDAPLQKEPR